MAQNEITKVLSTRLEELTERKRDIDYRLSDKKQAEQMGIPYPTFIKYKGDKAECPISTIVKMAEYYGVSTDYLLGRTKCETTDTNKAGAADYLGISEKAVEMIYGISKSYDFRYSNALNLILSSPQFALWVYAVRQWLNNLELLEGAIDIFKQKFYEYDEEPPKDIMKCAAEMSLSDPQNCCLHGEAYDVMSELDRLNYCEYKLQNQLKKLLDGFKKERE